MAMTPVLRRMAAFTLVVALGSACATLGQLRNLIQPPRFDQADGQPAEVRLVPLSRSQPLGGANVRVWMRVTNPNPFGLTLSTLSTTLRLDDRRAASGDFPLGLPLAAAADSVIPVDLTISFQDVPALATVVRAAANGRGVAYELEGTVGVDAGRFGQPTFGPMTFVRGEIGVANR